MQKLGLILESKLSIQAQVQTISQKMAQRIKTKDITGKQLPTKSLLASHQLLVLTHLEYAKTF